MDDEMSRTRLINELKELNKRIAELERSETRLKHEVETLQKSEKIYSLLVEKGNDGIVLIQDGLLKFANSKMAEITGFTIEEEIGKPFIDFISPAFKEAVYDIYKRRLAGEKVPKKYEIEINSKDGRNIPVEINASLIEYDGRPADMAIIRDFTEHRLSEEALRRQHDLLSRIIETSPAGIKTIDRQGRITFANSRAEEVLGLKKYDITQRTYNAPEWHMTDYEGNPVPDDKLFFRRVMETGKPVYGIQNAIQWPNGQRVLLSINASPLFDEGGRVEGVVVSVEDVTERVKTEKEIKQRSRELLAIASVTKIANRSLEFSEIVRSVLPEINNAVETDHVMIFLHEDNGKLTMKGFSSSKGDIKFEDELLDIGECLCGLAFSSGSNVFSEDIFADPRCTLDSCKKANIRSLAAILLTAGKTHIGVLALGSLTRRNFQDNDKFLSAIADALAISIEKSRLYEKIKQYAETLEQRVKERTYELLKKQRVLLALVDEQKKMGDELKNANLRLMELDRLKSMFIASTSHELRTPLNSIIGFSSILLEGWSGELNPEQKEQLQIVNSAGKHLLTLINDVIDISKIEAGRLEINIQEFNLRELVEEVVATFRTDISDKGLVLNVEVPNIILKTDRHRFLQCLYNLLSNAVKFTEKGFIDLTAKSINGMIDISVNDTGIGIKKEDIKKLFAPFMRLESPLTSKTTGTGLGLYLTKKLVQEVLGGTVDVKSEYGKGSIFTLHIPVELEMKR